MSEERWNPLNPRALERGGRHPGGFRALSSYVCRAFVQPRQGCLPTCNERPLQGNCPCPGRSTNSPQPSGQQLHGKHLDTRHVLHVARVFGYFLSATWVVGPQDHHHAGGARATAARGIGTWEAPGAHAQPKASGQLGASSPVSGPGRVSSAAGPSEWSSWCATALFC